MNRLSLEKQAQVLSCLVEGNSIRATARITGRAKNTVLRLLCKVGKACLSYQDKYLVDLPCTRIECDEIWTYCYSKESNIPKAKQGQFGYGDVWTWTAVCADTKLIPTWAVGNRSAEVANYFMQDLAFRLKNKVQLTTDGYRPYLDAVEDAFGIDVDYGMLVKLYGDKKRENKTPETQKRYSPFACTGVKSRKITGNPDLDYISTSYAERQNLNMRMSMRRFTRLTNAFSKKIDNLIYAIALHFMYYNFGRIHKSLRVTPAIEAGMASHVWELEEIADLAN